MKYEISYKPGLSAMLIKGFGQVSRKGIREFHHEYLGDDRWRPGMNVIIDFRKIIFRKFKPNDIDFIKDLVISSKEEIGSGKLAIVISTENDFGLARMWEMKTDSFVDFNISVFRELEVALNWIKGEQYEKENGANE